MAGTEGQKLETVWTRLEGACHLRRHPYGVQRADLLDVIFQLHPTVARQDDVDLLGLIMTVRESLAAVGLDYVEGQPNRLRSQILASEAGLLDGVEAEFARDVVDLAQVLDRVIHGTHTLTIGAQHSVERLLDRLLSAVDIEDPSVRMRVGQQLGKHGGDIAAGYSPAERLRLDAHAA